MMQTSIDIPVTIVCIDNTDFIQTIPSPNFERLAAARRLNPQIDIVERPQLDRWYRAPTNRTAQRNFRSMLERFGQTYLELEEGETLGSILRLSNDQIDWRRILVYTDSIGSRVPIEALWSDEQKGGQKIGFVAANSIAPVSIVRHLGLEAAEMMKVKAGEPLQMLVVFSNPKQTGYNLGSVEKDGKYLSFQDDPLGAEQKALIKNLDALVQLELLQIHFLVGDETRGIVYEGQVEFDKRKQQLLWTITDDKSTDLQNTFVRYLKNNNWHILHYFGHGTAGEQYPELVLRPGENISSLAIGARITRMPRIVIINACQSANAGNANVPVLSGFATLFLMRDTVNLVCMQMTVTYNTATQTTSELYSRLAQSLFTRQMDFEEALYAIRRKVYDTDQPPQLDFFCPVLYARPVNGPIFKYQDDRMDVWRLAHETDFEGAVEQLSTLYVESTNERRFDYQNKDLETWKLIQEQRIPLLPWRLYQVAKWSSKLNKVK